MVSGAKNIATKVNEKVHDPNLKEDMKGFGSKVVTGTVETAGKFAHGTKEVAGKLAVGTKETASKVAEKSKEIWVNFYYHIILMNRQIVMNIFKRARKWQNRYK